MQIWCVVKILKLKYVSKPYYLRGHIFHSLYVHISRFLKIKKQIKYWNLFVSFSEYWEEYISYFIKCFNLFCLTGYLFLFHVLMDK